MPNVFPDSFLINPLCAHAMFERFTDREWHNPPGTSSDSRCDPLKQSCLGVGNSKTRRTLCQQLTIIYCSMFRLLTVAQEREKIFKGLWIDPKRSPLVWPNSLNANFILLQLTTNWLTAIYLKISKQPIPHPEILDFSWGKRPKIRTY